MINIHSDKELINRLGGTKAVAEHLGVSEQRVSNWKRRGIPPQVRLDNLKLFGLKNSDQQKTPSDN